MFKILDPKLQIDFSVSLIELRTKFLQEALSATVRELDIADLDKSLADFVPKAALATLASHGLRGELMFAVPPVLTANARLLGYYRLLYGYSQKAFYMTETGISRFHLMEKNGKLTSANIKLLPSLCHAMEGAGTMLLNGLGTNHLSMALLNDLTLLTLGPQLRGGANVKKGTMGIMTVFNVIHKIVKSAVTSADANRIKIKNAAGRMVLIEFSADPDIIIREQMAGGNYSKKIAIEVKGGSDFSNIHNRIGEAEKSHQKAHAMGYVECWTVVNVDKIDITMAKQESPTTNRFYRISDLTSGNGAAYQDFLHRIISLTGIKSASV